MSGAMTGRSMSVPVAGIDSLLSCGLSAEDQAFLEDLRRRSYSGEATVPVTLQEPGTYGRVLRDHAFNGSGYVLPAGGKIPHVVLPEPATEVQPSDLVHSTWPPASAEGVGDRARHCRSDRDGAGDGGAFLFGAGRLMACSPFGAVR
jgi:hypothetical protein